MVEAPPHDGPEESAGGAGEAFRTLTVVLRSLGIAPAPPPFEMVVYRDLPDPISRRLAGGAAWQRPVLAVLASLLGTGHPHLFVDVGAHIGFFSTVMAHLLGPVGGRVIAFEPDPRNFAVLTRNAATWPARARHRGERRAVGAADGTATFHWDAAQPWAGSLVREPLHTRAVAVPVRTLTTLLAGEPRVSLVKIDVQGGEWAVIEGALPWLRSCGYRPFLLLELAPARWLAEGTLERFAVLVRELGYDVHLFLASEAAHIRPPRVDLDAFLALCRSIAATTPTAELDILLAPAGFYPDGAWR